MSQLVMPAMRRAPGSPSGQSFRGRHCLPRDLELLDEIPRGADASGRQVPSLRIDPVDAAVAIRHSRRLRKARPAVAAVSVPTT